MKTTTLTARSAAELAQRRAKASAEQAAVMRQLGDALAGRGGSAVNDGCDIPGGVSSGQGDGSRRFMRENGLDL